MSEKKVTRYEFPGWHFYPGFCFVSRGDLTCFTYLGCDSNEGDIEYVRNVTDNLVALLNVANRSISLAELTQTVCFAGTRRSRVSTQTDGSSIPFSRKTSGRVSRVIPYRLVS